jgi:hypothetical protein
MRIPGPGREKRYEYRQAVREEDFWMVEIEQGSLGD